MEIEKIRKRIAIDSKKKEYWKDGLDVPRAIALIHSEVSEALQADRKNRNADTRAFDKQLNYETRESESLFVGTSSEREEILDQIFRESFNEHIKDSMGDELADTIIRTLDLANELNIPIERHISMKMKYNEITKPTKKY